MKAVIFDFDGVIVSSEWPTFVLLQDIFKRNGLQLEAARFPQRIGKKVELFVDEVVVGAAVKNNIITDFYDEFSTDTTKYVEPITPTVEFIKQYSGPCMFAIASSGARKSIDAITNNLGITNKFFCITSSDDVSQLKPHPDVYILAMKRLGIQPIEAMIIEDSIIGVEAAYRAGCKPHVLLNGGNKKTDFDKNKIAGFLQNQQEIAQAAERSVETSSPIQ